MLGQPRIFGGVHRLHGGRTFRRRNGRPRPERRPTPRRLLKSVKVHESREIAQSAPVALSYKAVPRGCEAAAPRGVTRDRTLFRDGPDRAPAFGRARGGYKVGGF